MLQKTSNAPSTPATTVSEAPSLTQTCWTSPILFHPMIGQNFTVTSVNDGCVLEFDFVSGGDSISFNYVFGSDEYETWINTQYNDVFAFFLSGPGITGPFDSPAGFPDGAVNIAGVPDTDPILPITISSVNSGTNAVYYEDNQGGNRCLHQRLHGAVYGRIRGPMRRQRITSSSPLA